MFENEWLPQAMRIGITYQEFWDTNPHILNFYMEQYKTKRNEEDLKQWQLGQYMAAAVSCVFPKGKYPKKPMFQIENIEESTSYKESHEEAAVFEMKQRINLLRQQGLPESPI